MDEILKRLAEAREQAGLTQAQAGKLIGLSTSGFCDMEKGRSPLTVERMLELCTLYGINSVWALTGVNPFFSAEKTAEMLTKLDATRGEITRIMRILESTANA